MESQINIYSIDNSILYAITFNTDSYRRWQVMGEHSITLNFSLPQIPNGITEGFIEIPVGSYINFQNRIYTLYNPSDFTKNGNRKYDYTLKLYAYQELLYDRIFINEPDGMQVFPRQGRPYDFLRAIVRNMNKFETDNWDSDEWSIGEFVTSEVQQLVQFNGVSCMEALRLVTEAFKTEWEVNNKVISLRKIEYNKSNPVSLSYGKGNGFIPGLGRANYDESRPVHKLYVKGGDRNIEYSTYGSQNLLLPKNETIRFDGTKFEDETGYNSTIAREYQTSADGTYLTRIGTPQTSRREAFIELTEAYPKYVGTITDIIWVYNNVEYNTYEAAYDVAKNEPETETTGIGAIFCDVIDSGIPQGMDFSAKDENGKTLYRIDGEQFILCPQTGRLSGVELAIQQDQDTITGYNHSERRFKLITDSYYGGFIPDSRLQIGDTYAIFGFRFTGELADEYIGIGERDLFKEAVRYKYENEDLRFTFKGELDGIYAQANWSEGDNIGGRIVAGGYVNFSDPHFHPDGTLIRIAAIKEFLHEPYKPTLELTNIVIGGGLKGELAEIPQQEIVISEQERQARRLEQRRWRDVQELRNEIGNVFTEFTESINPVSVQSMQIIAGSERGQFRFVASLNSNVVAPNAPIINFNSSNNTIQISGNSQGSTAYIQHLTLGISNLDGKSIDGLNGTAIRPASEYRFWSLPSVTLNNPERDKLYWIYARCSKGGTAGQFIITTDIYDNFDDGTYYWLVVGALNSEYEGTRSWAPLFGFTEILPGQIITPLIRSNDGRTYFDLVNGIIGGRIRFIGADNLEHDLLEAMNEKVQTWIQSSDPSYNWTTLAVRNEHIGDIWYNTYTQQILRYNGSSWASFGTDGSKVFTTTVNTTPQPPYKIGDLWLRPIIDAITLKEIKTLYRSLQNRVQGSSYNVNDWVIATDYDNTQVAIDRGVVSAGRLEVGNGTLGSVLAGITGQGTSGDSVRIWAGGNYTNRANAPFMVTQDGTMYSTNGYIGGIRIGASGLGTRTLGTMPSTFINIDGYSLGTANLPYYNQRILYGIAGSPTTENAMAAFYNSGNSAPDRTIFISADRGTANTVGAHITASGSGTALQVNNSGSGAAIEMLSGHIASLKMRCRQITSGITLDANDVYISCRNSSTITITLPTVSDNSGGRIIYIRGSRLASVNVAGGGRYIDNGVSRVTNMALSSGNGDLGMFMWDGLDWLYNRMLRS